MEITQASQIDVNELLSEPIDVFLFAGGNEKRCRFLFENYKFRSQRTLVLIRKDRTIFSGKKPTKFHEIPNLEYLELSSGSSVELIQFFESIRPGTNKSKLNILVDYSCMSKNWYASIINYLIMKDMLCETINMFFAYIPVSYSEPQRFPSKSIVRPLMKGSTLHSTGKTKNALLLGLGFDAVKANNILRKLNPEIFYLLFSEPAFDSRFTGKVLQLNRRIIKKAGPGHLIPYPLQDMGKTDEILTSLILDLRLNYRVSVAPLGPKILTLSCLLLFARFPDIEIWTAGADIDYHAEDSPIDEPVIFKAVFVNDANCE